MRKNGFLVLGLCAGLFLTAGCGQSEGAGSSVLETAVIESENSAEAEAILASGQEIPEKLDALCQVNGMSMRGWIFRGPISAFRCYRMLRIPDFI